MELQEHWEQAVVEGVHAEILPYALTLAAETAAGVVGVAAPWAT
jgi:hypothetical protein